MATYDIHGAADAVAAEAEAWVAAGYALDAKLDVRNVKVPALDMHEGVRFAIVRLIWICPRCGGPRGDIIDAISYDGSRRLGVNGWKNECGHVDQYQEVRDEARMNGLNR